MKQTRTRLHNIDPRRAFGTFLEFESCRRIVARQSVVDPEEQWKTTNEEKRILAETYEYCTKKKHAFEGLAAFIAERVLGHQCRRGWVTKRSGDGGVDFVCRLDVGDPVDLLAYTAAVVLGQAKCVALNSQIGGQALARVVARLQRGWIGVFVTTGVFSRAAQLELAQDRYPVVLINGQRLARVLFEVLTQERIGLQELLDRETEWYLRNSTHFPPSRILEDAFSFTSTNILPNIQNDDQEDGHIQRYAARAEPYRNRPPVVVFVSPLW